MPTGHAHTAPAQGLSLGDDATFDAIFRQYFPALCHFAGQLLPSAYAAEDLVIDCFARLWEKKVTIHHAAALKGFLYTTVRHACTNLLQKKTVPVTPLPDGEDSLFADTAPSILDALIRSETLRHIWDQVDQFPRPIREVFTLHYLAGQSDKEISAAVRRPYQTVRTQRLRGIELLQAKLLATKK